MQKNHFLLLKKSKNTESAQLCMMMMYVWNWWLIWLIVYLSIYLPIYPAGEDQPRVRGIRVLPEPPRHGLPAPRRQGGRAAGRGGLRGWPGDVEHAGARPQQRVCQRRESQFYIFTDLWGDFCGRKMRIFRDEKCIARKQKFLLLGYRHARDESLLKKSWLCQVLLTKSAEKWNSS